MTLSEAIIHCEEVADRCAVTDGNAKCEMEHRQLAEWLKELAAAEDRIRKLEEELKDERHAAVMTSGIKGDAMTDKDKEATDKLNKWLSDIGLSEECNKDYCNIETKDNELTELIKEQHRNE